MPHLDGRIHETLEMFSQLDAPSLIWRFGGDLNSVQCIIHLLDQHQSVHKVHSIRSPSLDALPEFAMIVMNWPASNPRNGQVEEFQALH